MKGKPDIRAAQRNQFIRDNQSAAAEGVAAAEPAAPVRITKTIRMDRALDLVLKQAALDRTVASGARVTESDLIEQSIRQYLKL